jgi:hypothetical protein
MEPCVWTCVGILAALSMGASLVRCRKLGRVERCRTPGGKPRDLTARVDVFRTMKNRLSYLQHKTSLFLFPLASRVEANRLRALN